MRIVAAAVLLMVGASTMAADIYTPGYVRRDGVYVQPHYSTSPNSTRMDNYSTRGNVNPYTGQQGTVNPYSYSSPSPSPYIGTEPSRARRLIQ